MKTIICLFVIVFAFIPALQAGEGKSEGTDGARLWAQTCVRCHNARPAKSFSDAQWDVIVHHMRVRANLTGEETRIITQYLKQTN